MSSYPRLRLLLALAAPPALAACSLALSTDAEQCTVDADCATRGFTSTACVQSVCVPKDAADGGDAGSDADAAVDPKWGCIGSVTWPASDPTQTVNFRGHFLTALTEQAIVGLDVKACGRLDVDCTTPLAAGTTDVDGYVNLTVPKNFSGFLQMIAAPADGIMPSIGLILPPQETSDPPDASIAAAVSVHLITKAAFDGLLLQINKTADPAQGHLFGLAVDCTGQPAAKVAVHADTISPQTIAYYTASTGIPSTTAQETASAGEAGFINLPPGTETITATSNQVMKKLGDYSALIRAGTITYLPMPPAP
jgi:hypothetical protein